MFFYLDDQDSLDYLDMTMYQDGQPDEFTREFTKELMNIFVTKKIMNAAADRFIQHYVDHPFMNNVPHDILVHAHNGAKTEHDRGDRSPRRILCDYRDRMLGYIYNERFDIAHHVLIKIAFSVLL